LVYMWLSAIEPLFFLQVLETSPCRGGSAEIYYCVNQGDLALMKLIPFLRSGISFLGSKRRYRPT
jgi:hypothetical protein